MYKIDKVPSIEHCKALFVIFISVSPLFFLTLRIIWKWYGTGDFLIYPQSTYYSSLAQSLLEFRTDVSYEDITFECMVVENRCETVYSLFLSIIRIPFVLLEIPFNLTSLMSYGVALVILILGLNSLMNNIYSDMEERFLRLEIRILLSTLFILGSPILYLLTRPFLYEEQQIWGLGLFLLLLSLAKTKNFPLMSFVVLLLLFTRNTFGFAGVFLLAFIYIFEYKKINRTIKSSILNFFLIALPFLIYILSLKLRMKDAWLNPMKVHSSFINDPFLSSREDLYGTFNLMFTVKHFLLYLFSTSGQFLREFPFVNINMEIIRAFPAFGASKDSDLIEPMVGLITIFPIGVISLVVLTIYYVKYLINYSFVLTYNFTITIAALVPVLLISSFFGVSYRYTVEFLPILFILTINLFRFRLFHMRGRNLFIFMMIVLIYFQFTLNYLHASNYWNSIMPYNFSEIVNLVNEDRSILNYVKYLIK
jgi:hypothetical protein